METLLHLLGPILLPVASLFVTEIVKTLSEKVFFKWPKLLSLAVAGALGATANEWVHVVPNAEIAGLLSLLAGQLHDVLTPPRPQGLLQAPTATVKSLLWLILVPVLALSGCATGSGWQFGKGFSQVPTVTTGFGRSFSTLHPAQGPVVLANTELANYGYDTAQLDDHGVATTLRFRYYAGSFCIGLGGSSEQAQNTLQVPTGLCNLIYDTATIGAHADLHNLSGWRDTVMGTVTIEPMKLDRSPLFRPLCDWVMRLLTPAPARAPTPVP